MLARIDAALAQSQPLAPRQQEEVMPSAEHAESRSASAAATLGAVAEGAAVPAPRILLPEEWAPSLEATDSASVRAAALEEAAMIDGCSRLGALFRVLVPVMTPGIIAAFIFNFVNCWNELFLSVVLMHSEENRTVPAALNGFISTFMVT